MTNITVGQLSGSPSFSPIQATGGTQTTIYVGNVQYRVHTFTTTGSSNFIVTDPGTLGQVEYLVVGGGGGGGMDMGGGGGGGGVIPGTTTVTAKTYPVVVGAGGWGAPAGGGYRGDGVGPQPTAHQFTIPGTNGLNSSVFGAMAIGGGNGGSSYYAYTPGASGNIGASGGGCSGYSDGSARSGSAGTRNQGYRGGNGGGQYYSGGGGGAGGNGIDSTNIAAGGPGTYSDILGTGYYWGGGGGGSGYSTTGGPGGIGGGGGGAVGSPTGGLGGAGYNNGANGTAGATSAGPNVPGGNGGTNTGGGGGGGSHYNATNQGGNGGSGIVIIRYPITDPAYGKGLYINQGSTFTAPGTILQTVFVRSDDITTYNIPVGTSAGQTITDLTIGITPKFANSIILLRFMINYEATYNANFVMQQNGGLINQSGYQGYNNVSGDVVYSGIASTAYDWNNQSSTPANAFIQYYIPANTLGYRTYAPAIRSSDASTYTFYLNRTVDSSGQDGYENMISTAFAMEIAQ